MIARRIAILSLLLSALVVAAAEKAPTAPPLGIAIPAAERTALRQKLDLLAKAIADVKSTPHSALLPDVQIFYNAVDHALAHDMFYTTNDVPAAHNLLRHGMDRAAQLRGGQSQWTKVTGLVVRGYVSEIDGSVQPYGLVIPPSYSPRPHKLWRMDFWLHGRDNNLSEVRFLNERLLRLGQITPPDTFVLHPYGRYCNAFKFAGETDCFEAMRHVQQHYPIDSQRICMRGFSMGGAGAWHLGAHHAGLWAAVAPGAGFVDTAIYQNLRAKETKPMWWEEKLWHLYDVPDCAANLANTGVVAYSGEVDPQKQAADLMAKAMAREGLPLTHIIGPKTGHKYEPAAKVKLEKLVDALAVTGRTEFPKQVRLVTWTLRYPTQTWVTLQGMDEHWQEARVDAVQVRAGVLSVKTQNASALTLTVPSTPEWTGRPVQIQIDQQTLSAEAAQGKVNLRKSQGRWVAVATLAQNQLAKLPGLQGPIDDAFYSAFIMVRPTGKPLNAAAGAWAQREMEHAITQWHRQFRGKPRVMDDTEVTNADIASANLVLWGDPSSNRVLAKIAGQLPIQWSATGVRVKDQQWPADKFVPALIYPNPLNPQRYVVLNSGFTFSEFGHQSNAQQVPKLPDYAVLEMAVPIQKRPANGVAHAGFFGEYWELTAHEGRPAR